MNDGRPSAPNPKSTEETRARTAMKRLHRSYRVRAPVEHTPKHQKDARPRLLRATARRRAAINARRALAVEHWKAMMAVPAKPKRTRKPRAKKAALRPREAGKKALQTALLAAAVLAPEE